MRKLSLLRENKIICYGFFSMQFNNDYNRTSENCFFFDCDTYLNLFKRFQIKTRLFGEIFIKLKMVTTNVCL